MEKQSKTVYNNDDDEKKKEPGKRCVGMFFNIKTNSDGVNMHQFSTDEISSTVDFFRATEKGTRFMETRFWPHSQ